MDQSHSFVSFCVYCHYACYQCYMGKVNNSLCPSVLQLLTQAVDSGHSLDFVITLCLML